MYSVAGSRSLFTSPLLQYKEKLTFDPPGGVAQDPPKSIKSEEPPGEEVTHVTTQKSESTGIVGSGFMTPVKLLIPAQLEVTSSIFKSCCC